MTESPGHQKALNTNLADIPTGGQLNIGEVGTYGDFPDALDFDDEEGGLVALDEM